MSQFYVGQKVVVVSEENGNAQVGSVCEVVKTKNLPNYIGIRYAHQNPNKCFPFQRPEWFCSEEIYNSPLYKALK